LFLNPRRLENPSRRKGPTEEDCGSWSHPGTKTLVSFSQSDEKNIEDTLKAFVQSA
jgi:hypothetical protein